MFLKQKSRDELIEVLTLAELFDPYNDTLIGRYQHGEEVQDPEKFSKQDLCFQSGEELPQCWTNAHYRDDEVQR
jgi:hypothetical protein